MSRLLPSAFVVLALSVVGAGAFGASSRPAIAASRCNSSTIDAASARIGDYDRHPPANTPNALTARYGAIADVISTLQEEHGILSSVCATDEQKTPLFTQIVAIAAWAIALESDIAARLNVSCPPAAQGFPTLMLADAWLSLANVVNQNGGAVPAEFSDVVPKIQSRAQTVGLTLPQWADTSQYWRDQLDAKEKPIIQACASPSPTRSP